MVKNLPLGKEKFSEKNLTMAIKTERGEALVSPGIVCYKEKKEKLFWFSSSGQIIRFVTIKFSRTFRNYFGQFVWIEKKTKKESLKYHNILFKKSRFTS